MKQASVKAITKLPNYVQRVLRCRVREGGVGSIECHRVASNDLTPTVFDTVRFIFWDQEEVGNRKILDIFEFGIGVRDMNYFWPSHMGVYPDYHANRKRVNQHRPAYDFWDIVYCPERGGVVCHTYKVAQSVEGRLADEIGQVLCWHDDNTGEQVYQFFATLDDVEATFGSDNATPYGLELRLADAQAPNILTDEEYVAITKWLNS